MPDGIFLTEKLYKVPGPDGCYFFSIPASWEVGKKTVTDVVLKMCRDSIINRVAYWVETQLLTDKDIGDTAVEDGSLCKVEQMSGKCN